MDNYAAAPLPTRRGPTAPTKKESQMIRAAVLATAVLLPALALADEVWRWKDPSAGACFPGPGLSDVGAAVDAQDLAGDPGAVGGGQEHRRAADLARLSGAAEWDRLQHGVAVIAEEALAHLRADDPRRDAVDAHAGGGHLLGEHLHQRVHPCLGHVVGRAAGAGQVGADRGDEQE